MAGLEGRGEHDQYFEGVIVVMCSRLNGWRRRIICGACGEKEEKQRHTC